MKKIRQISSNPVVIALVLFNFIFVSCNRDEIAKQQIEEKMTESIVGKLGNGNGNVAMISGEDIFKSIFFYQGVLSEKIDIVKDDVQELKNVGNYVDINENLKTLSNFCITKINQKDSGFFNSLKQAVYSNNFFEVSENLEYAASLIEQVILESEEYGSQYAEFKQIAQDENFLNRLSQINLQTENGKTELNNLISEYQQSNDIENELLGCVPWAGFCIVYAVAIGVSVAVGAYSAIGYAQVLVKNKYWVLDKRNGFETNDLKMQQLISSLCTAVNE